MQHNNFLIKKIFMLRKQNNLKNYMVSFKFY
jgi:hypothetical protein